MLDFKTGDSASIVKVISEEDVRSFAQVSGDLHPLHLDEEAAAKSFFGRRIAHGMLLAGFFSAVIAEKLPGKGSIYLSQTLRFMAPAFLGDEITVTVEVIEVMGKGKVKLATQCTDQSGKVILDGEAVVMVARSESEKNTIAE
ncbi:MAG: MaoC family dehydratase [Flavobacteriales bacterium]